MSIFPLIVVAVCGTFATIVFRQYLRRRRPYQLAWTAALTLGLLAGLFYVLFLLSHHDETMFRLYYVCGGLLMAAYLGLGSLYLHAPRRIANACAIALLYAGCLGAVLLFQAKLDPARLALAAHNVGPGTNAIGSGAWKAMVAILNSLGALAVIGGAIYSAWRTIKRHSPQRFLWANVLIATGTILAAIAGAAADQGKFAGAFWLVLALGFVVLFAGFSLTALPVRAEPTQTTVVE
ncbi:MAG TPA: hypothetical protein VG815_10340 [Chloroflexota bacterium]|jgi:uncharacterized membrane protein HdeD (DUF308 family)|nr:hypothetical protein [Chloroflexota bacterium]